MTKKNISRLVLGWKVDENLNPRAWVDGFKPKIPPPEKEIVSVPAENMSNHTVIVAQSGSGKSFFLGRLIEELVCKTRARLLVLDPNADFKSLFRIVEASNWKNPKFHTAESTGWLPTEQRRKEFSDLWPMNEICIFTQSPKNIGSKKHYKRIKLWLPDIPEQNFMATDDELIGISITHCHKFVSMFWELLSVRDMVISNSNKNRWLGYYSSKRFIGYSEAVFDRAMRMIKDPVPDSKTEDESNRSTEDLYDLIFGLLLEGLSFNKWPSHLRWRYNKSVKEHLSARIERLLSERNKYKRYYIINHCCPV